MARGHHEVDIEHVLLALLEVADSDLSVLCRRFDVPTSGLQRDLERELEGFKAGNTRTPVFSARLPTLFEHAWLIASLDAHDARIRSAHLLLALLTEASFAVGEARVQTIAYYPHFAGWHLTPADAGVALDLGHFRLRGDMSLYAVAGASIALEASAGLMLTASKQGLKGVPKQAKAAKAKASAEGKVELFAGLKEGIDLSGALQWLNPEGFIDEKSPKRKDQTKTWGEYADVATVGAGAAGIEGLAASLGFEVGYKNGNFVIACNADLCLGLGGSDNVSCKVGADSIGQFFMCVAHQLKQADYSKLTGLMLEEIFQGFNQVNVYGASGREVSARLC